MYVVAPASRLRRGVRRLTLALCALILGAGFTPALPVATAGRVPPPVAASAHAGTVTAVRPSTAPLLAPTGAAPESTPVDGAAGGIDAASAVVFDGVTVGAVAGRAPPRIPA